MIFTREDLAAISADADRLAEQAARMYLMAAKISAEIKRREGRESKPVQKRKAKKIAKKTKKTASKKVATKKKNRKK